MKKPEIVIMASLALLLALAACDDENPPTAPTGDPTTVSLEDLDWAYEFGTGLADSAGYAFSVPFRLSERLLGYSGLQLTIAGEWTTGSFEVVRDLGGLAVADTFDLFSRAFAEVTPADGSHGCLEALVEFPAAGDYDGSAALTPCCAGCAPAVDELTGRELRLDVRVGKGSPATAATVEGLSGTIASIRIDVLDAVVEGQE